MTEEKFISVNPGAGQGMAGGWSPADFAAVMGNQNRNSSGIFGSNMWEGVLGLFGLGIVSSMFGWNGNGNGNRGGNPNDAEAASYLANMMNNTAGRELLAQQITGVGDRVADLAAAFGTTTAAVQTGLNNINLAMVQLAAQNNMSVLQLQMALQKGQSDIALQFCSCCKDQALALCQQTNALLNAGNENTQRIVEAQNEGTRAILQQMYNDKLEAKNEKIAELTALALAKDGELSQLRQNQYLAGLVAQSQAQTDSKLNAIYAEVEAVKRCQPATITLPDNRYQAVPTGIANIGSDFIGTLAVARIIGLLGGGTTGTGGTEAPAAK